MQSEGLTPPNELPSWREFEALQRQLSEAHAMNRGLLRQLKKAQESATEAQRAHAKMVATLTETMRENTSLAIDRDMWKARAQRYEMRDEHDFPPGPLNVSALAGQITEDEANAIRKAIARLHHPDLGGDPERMKAWNAALDKIGKH
jgi:hypothetical protein